jgi:hypothetical protein
LAAGFPAVLWNFVAGQNGLLTAALVGGSLLLLERRPLVSGVLLGLLTYKPQFGVLFPLALAMDSRWRVMGVAAGTALALVAASVFCFGLEAWREFFSGMPAMTDAVFVQGRVGLHKLQTLLGVVRWLGGGMTLAWTLQGLLVSVCVVATAAAWRSRQPLEIKAATLSTAALLATPYLFIYDFVVLAVAIAFICSIASRTGFLRGEGAGLALAALCVLAAPIIAAPAGFVAALIVGLSVVRRARMAADARHTIIPMRAGLSSARS